MRPKYPYKMVTALELRVGHRADIPGVTEAENADTDETEENQHRGEPANAPLAVRAEDTDADRTVTGGVGYFVGYPRCNASPSSAT